ncbi:MAG: hypothetical protein NTX81_08905 [Candidatus Bathyarchaeota archaeon]|nr:hypothetical protein [Candidatus Bathyarchaeota archaeon]
MAASRTQALTFKSGPTESGAVATSNPVGGTLLPIDKLSVFLSNFWFILILLLLVPFGIIFYKKRDVALKSFMPLISRFLEYRRSY